MQQARVGSFMRKVVAGPTEALVAKGLPPVRWDGRLTNSSRSTFLNCRKKFEWAYLRRLSPRQPSLPFLVGGLYHNGLERMYAEGHFDEEREEGLVAEACERACMAPGLTGEMSDRVWEQQALVMGMLTGYARLYLKKDLAKWEVIKAESGFEFKLANGWVNAGKRDLLVRVRGKQDVGLVEHKTTAYLNASYVAKLPLDSQILGYALSMKKDTGRLPAWVLYNVVRKAQLRRKVKETFEQFQKRLRSVYVLEAPAYYYREVLRFDPREVAQYERRLNAFAAEMQRAVKEGNFYENSTQCTVMGTCPFMRLCIDGPTPQNLAHYRVRKHVHEELAEEDSD